MHKHCSALLIISSTISIAIVTNVVISITPLPYENAPTFLVCIKLGPKYSTLKNHNWPEPTHAHHYVRENLTLIYAKSTTRKHLSQEEGSLYVNNSSAKNGVEKMTPHVLKSPRRKLSEYEDSLYFNNSSANAKVRTKTPSMLITSAQTRPSEEDSSNEIAAPRRATAYTFSPGIKILI